MAPSRRTVSLALVLSVAALSAACAGRSVRAGVTVGPRLTAARLGEVRGAMTYDGDWLGGTPPLECLAADLDLASRRGVEILVDMRSARIRSSVPLAGLAGDAGLEVVEVDLLEGFDGAEAPEVPITDRAVDRIRQILKAPGRRRTLLLDDDGRLASTVYAVHLAVDENVPATMALRAARSTGLSDACELFVKEQVARIRRGS